MMSDAREHLVEEISQRIDYLAAVPADLDEPDYKRREREDELLQLLDMQWGVELREERVSADVSSTTKQDESRAKRDARYLESVEYRDGLESRRIGTMERQASKCVAAIDMMIEADAAKRDYYEAKLAALKGAG